MLGIDMNIESFWGTRVVWRVGRCSMLAGIGSSEYPGETPQGDDLAAA